MLLIISDTIGNTTIVEIGKQLPEKPAGSKCFECFISCKGLEPPPLFSLLKRAIDLNIGYVASYRNSVTDQLQFNVIGIPTKQEIAERIAKAMGLQGFYVEQPQEPTPRHHGL